ncbi:hypothetical protein N665_0366s0001 [Sinapis alba]|nr:hypothetical protein N665_0366s0001 [Sinapis alba]
MSDLMVGDIIYFKEKATADQAKPRNNLLVVELTIQNIDITRVLVDTGSSAGIIFRSTLERMEIDLSKAEGPSPLIELSGEATMTHSSINLAVRAGSITKDVEFLVIDHSASYNVIVGTQWLNSMQVVPSTFHMYLKFPTLRGVKTIWGDWKISQVCFTVELKRKKLNGINFS